MASAGEEYGPAPGTGSGLPYTSKLFAARAALLVILLLGWHWLSIRLGPFVLPDLLEVARRLLEICASGELLSMSAITLGEVAGGLILGGGLGILLPFLVSRSPRLARTVEPFIKMTMGVPKLALSPIIILWFGIGLFSKIVLIALMVFFMIFVSTFAGIRSADIKLMSMCRILGANQTRLTREILWYSALPFIMAAIKTALPWAINAAIVAEFLAADAGLGYYIRHAYDSADTVGAFAGVVAVTILMVLIDFGFSAFQKYMLRWRQVDVHAVH